MWEFQKISSKKSCHTCPATSRTHGESFLKTSLQASTVHMQAVEIARHMLGIYNTFSPSPSFLLFDRSTDRQEHTRPHAHCSPHTCVHSAQIRPRKGRQHQWRESRENAKASRTQTAAHTQTNRCARQPTHPKRFKKHYETPDSCSRLAGVGGGRTKREGFAARSTQLDMETTPSPNIHTLGSQRAGTDR